MRTWLIPALYIVLALMSITTLSSVAPSLASKQLLSFIIGGVVYLLAYYIPWETYRNTQVYQYGFAVFILILPLVAFGSTRNTHRWIELGGGQTFQPSQLAIPLTVMLAAQVLTRAKEITWLTLAQFFAVIGLPAVLIFVEPDLGSTIVYGASLSVLLLVTPVSWKKLLTLLSVSVIAAVIGWLFLLQPYQKARITTFLSPESSDNYNAQQALIAVGSGGVLGRGIGQGVQSHLKFLPERQTDFIFASFAEEYGFFGTSILIILYGILVAYLLYASQFANDSTAQLLFIVAAVVCMMQTSVNVLMNMGLLPITGITLPFVSYGGSSIISMAFFLGMVQSGLSHYKPKATLHIS